MVSQEVGQCVCAFRVASEIIARELIIMCFQ
jgi:hypothetical protein